MGLDLLNSDGKFFSLNWQGWRYALDNAIDYGWKPMGTTHEEIEDWGGSYTSNDGQVITVNDACCVSKSLKKAVADGKADYLLELALFMNKKSITIY